MLAAVSLARYSCVMSTAGSFCESCSEETTSRCCIGTASARHRQDGIGDRSERLKMGLSFRCRN